MTVTVPNQMPGRDAARSSLSPGVGPLGMAWHLSATGERWRVVPNGDLEKVGGWYALAKQLGPGLADSAKSWQMHWWITWARAGTVRAREGVQRSSEHLPILLIITAYASKHQRSIQRCSRLLRIAGRKAEYRASGKTRSRGGSEPSLSGVSSQTTIIEHGNNDWH